MIGGPVSQAFEDYFGALHKDAVPFRKLSPSVGGHEQLVVGYSRRANGELWFLVLNSWGSDAGLASFPGCSFYAESAIDEQDEAFSVFRAPELF